MLDALTYDCLIAELKEKYRGEKKAIGILFARPSSKLVKDEIINDLEYYHHRSGERIDIFFPGYGAYWNDTYPDKQTLCTLNGATWYFSAEHFSRFVSVIEQLSKWEYSGETELVIIDYDSGGLDFSNTTRLWIEKAIEDKAVRSARNLMEDVFRVFEKYKSTFSASDQLAFDSCKESAIEVALKKIPYGLGGIYNRTQFFCTRNLVK